LIRDSFASPYPLLLKEIGNDDRIDLSRPCSHGQAVERREPGWERPREKVSIVRPKWSAISRLDIVSSIK
jgi:hypothetical protein